MNKSRLKTIQNAIIKRLFSTEKRKYPINPEEAAKLPVFEYATSKKSYQRVFVWGNIQTGALGVPYIMKNKIATKLAYIKFPKKLGFAEKFEVTTAACGFGFTLFAVNDKDNDVKLYGTGLNTDSQVGYHAIRTDRPLEIIYFPQRIPLPIKNPKKCKIIQLSAGRAHSAVLTDTEGLFLFGNNSYGQCARKIIENEDYFKHNYINNIKTVDNKRIVNVECGQDHTLVLAEDGTVYASGWGADGQTGVGSFNNTEFFMIVQGDIKGEKIIKVSSRSDFVLALSDKGEVFGWGNSEYGQISKNENLQQVCQPIHLKHLNNFGKIIDVASGGSFCLILNENRHVFAWGYGILGAGPKAQQSYKPIQIPENLFGKNDFHPDNVVEKVKCGLYYSMCVTKFGDVFGWGRNLSCCLGLGDEKDQFFPFKVSLGGYAKDVFCGLDHTIAICKPFI